LFSIKKIANKVNFNYYDILIYENILYIKLTNLDIYIIIKNNNQPNA